MWKKKGGRRHSPYHYKKVVFAHRLFFRSYVHNIRKKWIFFSCPYPIQNFRREQYFSTSYYYNRSYTNGAFTFYDFTSHFTFPLINRVPQFFLFIAYPADLWLDIFWTFMTHIHIITFYPAFSQLITTKSTRKKVSRICYDFKTFLSFPKFWHFKCQAHFFQFHVDKEKSIAYAMWHKCWFMVSGKLQNKLTINHRRPVKKSLLFTCCIHFSFQFVNLHYLSSTKTWIEILFAYKLDIGSVGKKYFLIYCCNAISAFPTGHS